MKNKLSIIACAIACITFLSADEFFEAGSTIGGYGELHWNKASNSDGELTKNQMDFHRFIIYYGYNWTEKWSFKSEVELEHNFLPGGELELEQAYVNYHTDKWGFQGGVILPTAGLLNEHHEPPLFLSVERPLYSKYIIPTTWFGNGFAFYGKLNDFGWRIAILEDLNGSKITNGIRDARGKGYKTYGTDLLKNLSLSYTGITGLRIGGSVSMNNAPITFQDDAGKDYILEDGKVKASIGINLFEVNAKYDANNIYAVAEYGQISYDNSNYSGFTGGNTTGYYFDLGYNIGDMVNCGKLIPWLRVSNVTRDAEAVDSSKNSDLMRFGLTWWPIDNIAFKLDYANVGNEASSDKTSELNIGIGYNF